MHFAADFEDDGRSTPGDGDVWLVDTSSLEDRWLDDYLQLIDDEERTRWSRFRDVDAQRQFLIGRALLRTSLSRYTDVHPTAWRFNADRFGKPSIAAPSRGVGIAFNLSHTRGLVACAVALGSSARIGVDVERADRVVDHAALAGRVLTPVEADDVHRAPEGLHGERFLAYWTLKEAYLKARGLGLSLPLDSFSFELSSVHPRITFGPSCPDDPDRWAFRRFAPTAAHLLAVAWRDVEGDIAVRWTIPRVPTLRAA